MIYFFLFALLNSPQSELLIYKPQKHQNSRKDNNEPITAINTKTPEVKNYERGGCQTEKETLIIFSGR